MMLRFDFLGRSVMFTDPEQIIQTNHPDEVIAKLAEVEQYVTQGYYAAGYLAYEAASAFQPYYQIPPQGELPLLWFAICKQPTLLPPNQPQPQYMQLQWQSNTTQQQYQHAIEYIKNQIELGNTYQVNYTLRLDSQFTAQPYPFYLYLLNAQQANYSAYLDTGRFKILSASPELFFHKQNDLITTKPMKGTSPRGTTFTDDLLKKQALFSEKNQAENVMIVDLLRNDLSQIAKPGSVQVTQLFAAEKYPTVWQLTSTVTANIDAKLGLSAIFKALFPCGSITGAPKASTMKVIAELEHQAREVYCGAIGYVTPNQEAIFNVPIRTVIIDSQQATAQYGVGGGITWDSTSIDEYQETLDKAQILYGVKQPLQLLETLLLEQGEYFLLTEHLQRLSESAQYFEFLFNAKVIHDHLEQLAKNTPQDQWKIRLLLNKQGTITLEKQRLIPSVTPLLAQWAPTPMITNNRFLYHKTTERSHYPVITPNHEYLMFNERDEITEFVNGNVVLLINNQLVTPKISCGLLPGTMRNSLLQQDKIKEAVIQREQLKQAEKIFFINSVRKWQPIHWLMG